ncbi:MAG TPA: hypothetical protein VKU80_10255 [Planctomycetota bacterium]|nr:hypothetical protein [Planctomycetota bacterium]
MMSLRTSEATGRSDDGSHVKIFRKLADGTMEVFWDDREFPVDVAQSKTLV